MYQSTKNYIKEKILELIEQCNDRECKNGSVTINDIQKIIDEIKFDNMSEIEKEFVKMKDDTKIKYNRTELKPEDVIIKICEYNEAINNLHTHISIED